MPASTETGSAFSETSNNEKILFTSESVGEGHPGKEKAKKKLTEQKFYALSDKLQHVNYQHAWGWEKKFSHKMLQLQPRVESLLPQPVISCYRLQKYAALLSFRRSYFRQLRCAY